MIGGCLGYRLRLWPTDGGSEEGRLKLGERGCAVWLLDRTPLTGAESRKGVVVPGGRDLAEGKVDRKTDRGGKESRRRSREGRQTSRGRRGEGGEGREALRLSVGEERRSTAVALATVCYVPSWWDGLIATTWLNVRSSGGRQARSHRFQTG